MIYWLLFFEFFKIGLFTIGGGYAMIPLIRQVVLKYEWATENEFSNFLGVCESTPGPIAVNMATYIGSTQGGPLGSLCATLGVVLPSFIIIVLIAAVFHKFTNNKYFKNFIKGVGPAITALILSTGVLMFIKCIGVNVTNMSINLNMVSIIILGIIIVLYFIVTKILKKKISTILLILISAFLGIGFGYLLIG
jgi:chromate transporter